MGISHACDYPIRAKAILQMDLQSNLRLQLTFEEQVETVFADVKEEVHKHEQC